MRPQSQLKNDEDIYFCLKTRNLEPRPTILVHTGVRGGHLLNPEPIEFDTRTLLTNFYDNLAGKFNDVMNIKPEEEQINNQNNRNLEYIERNLKRL